MFTNEKHAGGPRRRGRKIALTVALALLLTLSVAGTVAYLATKTKPVKNTFEPTTISTTVEESFNGTVKSNVVVRNNGTAPAYIRVALVVNNVFVDTNNNVTGICSKHPATLPSFTLGTGWVKFGNYYYYTSPVAGGGVTTALIDSATLAGEEGCCKMQLEVIASAIQADGKNSDNETPVQNAWNVTIANGTVTAYTPAG